MSLVSPRLSANTPGLAYVGPLTYYSGTGLPNAALGANGDFYFRQDGAVGACIYQKRSGAWVATSA